MTYEPTDAEVYTLARSLHVQYCDYSYCKDGVSQQDREIARYVLRHYEPRNNEQRCGGSGKFLSPEPGTQRVEYLRCPGCSRCKPRTEQAKPLVGPVEHDPATMRLSVRCDNCGQLNASSRSNCKMCDIALREDSQPTVTEVRLAEDQFRVLIATVLPRDVYDDWDSALDAAKARIAAAKEKP